jgi:hypothetical protein
MSHSRRHNPIFTVVHCKAGSRKFWKGQINRKFRRKTRVTIKVDGEPLLLREVSDLWTSPTDGEPYYFHRVAQDPSSKYWRK